jgi:hypothetical protein
MNDAFERRLSWKMLPLLTPPRLVDAISKAVVVFGATTKTYGDNIWSPVTGGCAVEASMDTFSFDDPAFWNGILTWS